jgi:hypothetical protein
MNELPLLNELRGERNISKSEIYSGIRLIKTIYNEWRVNELGGHWGPGYVYHR